MFHRFAVVKGNAFGVVAHAHQGIAVIAVEFFVFVIVANQRMANPHGDDGGKNHENKHKINNAMRNFDAEDIQHAGQPPQHHAEPDRRDGGIEHAAHKFNGIGDKFLRVLLNTLVDIVRRVAVGL